MDCRQYSYVFLFNNYQNNVFITIIINRRKKRNRNNSYEISSFNASFKVFFKVFANLKTFHHQQRLTDLPIAGSQDWVLLEHSLMIPSISAYTNTIRCMTRRICIIKRRKEALSVCHELHAVVTCYGNGK